MSQRLFQGGVGWRRGLHSCNSCGCGFLVAFWGLLLNSQQCQQCWPWEECRWHGLECRHLGKGAWWEPCSRGREPWAVEPVCDLCACPVCCLSGHLVIAIVF